MKVYLVNYTLVLDGCYVANENTIFASKDDAKEHFNKLIEGDKENVEENDWKCEFSGNSYESWNDSSIYMMNHCSITLYESEIIE